MPQRRLKSSAGEPQGVPSAESLKRYEDAYPGAAQWLMDVAREVIHFNAQIATQRMESESKLAASRLDSETRIREYSIQCGTGVTLALTALAAVCALAGERYVALLALGPCALTAIRLLVGLSYYRPQK